MSQQPTESADLPVSTTMAHLRRRKREATQALLGDTISISDEAWQQPSRLDGWTRAHVATHIARNADGLRRVAHGLLTHSPGQMYPDPRVRDTLLRARPWVNRLAWLSAPLRRRTVRGRQRKGALRLALLAGALATLSDRP